MKKLNVIKWSAPSILLVLAGSVVATPADIDVDGTTADDPYDSAPIVRQASRAIDEFLAGPFNGSAQSDMSVPMGGEGVGEFSGGPLNGPTNDVTTGLEVSLNLEFLGWNGTDAINVAGWVTGGGSGDFVSNQLIGGIDPPQSPNLGTTATDFTVMMGDQFLTVDPGAVSTALPTLDGSIDMTEAADYANATSGWSQDSFTNFGDNNDPDVAVAGGSELDSFYAYVSDPNGSLPTVDGDETLNLLIGGNQEINGNNLHLHIDCRAGGLDATFEAGGLSNLNGPNITLEVLSDWGIQYNVNGGGTAAYFALVEQTGGGFSAGNGNAAFGLTSLEDGMMNVVATANYDNSNVLGVAGTATGGSLGGTDVANESDPALDDTGVELRVNLTELVTNVGETLMPAFDPTAMGQGFDGMGGGVRVSGFIIEANAVSNQVVGGLPLGTGVLDAVSGVDFSAIAGDQFAVIGDTTMAAITIDGTRDAAYGGPEYVNPGNSTTRGSAQGPSGADDDPLGSELNNLSGVLRNEAGDWILYLHAGATLSDFDRLYLYLDHTDEAGENELSGFNPNIDDDRSNNASGLTFDAGFDADALLVYRLGTDEAQMPPVVSHFFDGVEITTDAGDLEIGGNFDGGDKTDLLAGSIEARRGFGNNTIDVDPMDPSAFPQADANGDELAGMFAYLEERTVNGVTDTYMTLMLTGNLKPVFNKIDIFLDVDTTFGQNTLIWDGDLLTGEGTPADDAGYVGNPSVDFDALQAFGGPFPDLSTPAEEDPNDTVMGITFDNSVTRGVGAVGTFLPDHYITMTLGNLSDGDDMTAGTADDDGEIFMNFARLRSPGMDGLFDADNMGDDDPGVGVFLGSTTVQAANQALLGGQVGGNGAQWEVAVNNENTGGVPGGGSPFGINATQSNLIGLVETGIEISFPVSTLQVDTDSMAGGTPWDGRSPIGVMAMLGNNSHTFFSSQVLPPVCSDELGDPRLIDFNTFDGQQHVFMQAPAMGEGSFTALAGQDFLTFDECAEPTGACYILSGGVPTCFDDVTESTCVGTFGGNWLGADTTCAGAIAACCLEGDPSCLDLTEDQCMMAGGDWQGFGMDLQAITCASEPCPTGPVNSCLADFDNNGQVDLTDFGTFGQEFGRGLPGGGPACTPMNPCVADFDDNGQVDLTDFGTFGQEFGRGLPGGGPGCFE